MSTPSVLKRAVEVALARLSLPRRASLCLVINDPDRATPSGVVIDALLRTRPDLRCSALISCGSHRHDDARRAEHVAHHHLDRLESVIWHRPEVDSPWPEGIPVLGIGSVEPHWFAGWTGAHKTLTVGLWSRARIERNHAGALEPTASVCRLIGNPVYEGIARALEARHAAHTAPVVAINLVVDPTGALLAAVAGAPLESLRAAIDAARARFVEHLDAPLDRLVARVASPLDRSLYQALKGVKNSAGAVRDGGAIVLVAACPDGVGIDHFMALLRAAPDWTSADALIRSRGYRLGDHKAVRLRALTDQRGLRLAVVSRGLSEEDARLCGMRRFEREADALAWAREVAPGDHERALEDAGNCVLRAPLDVTAAATADTAAIDLDATLVGEAVSALVIPRAPRADEDGDLGRYRDLGELGRGGMAEVRRVLDPTLGRTVAMKVIHETLASRPRALARFVAEAQLGAQLQHPGLLPVYEVGSLPDGRPFFTMQELRGRHLGALIHAWHQSETAAEGWTLRRLLGAFQRVCETLAFAHERGVIHRDLKPQNIMVGDNDEVFVVDWGIARSPGAAALVDDVDPETLRAPSRVETQAGVVAGTPAYMPPEQALGDRDQIDRRSDVYALGAILYELLCGHAPYHDVPGESAQAILMHVLQAPPRPLAEHASRPIDPTLIALCERAMARERDARFPDAGALAAAVTAWLDGVQRRERAMTLVDEAAARLASADGKLERAAREEGTGGALLAPLPTWAPAKKKHDGWRHLDAGAALRAEASLDLIAAERTLHEALTHAPDLPEAHVALAQHHERAHRAAEAAGDPTAARQIEVRLAAHVEALPRAHSERARLSDYLEGAGALTLRTTPSGATAELYRYELAHRRLAPRWLESLGTTPIEAHPLPPGRYLIRLQRKGRHEVRYPVWIRRQEHWDAVPPEGDAPRPIALPAIDTLDEDSVHVPAGWFLSGGDPEAPFSTPSRRHWVDSFAIQRFPVCNQDYLAFLNDLVDRGLEPQALRWAPRMGSGRIDDGEVVYGRDPDGHFILVADADGDVWQPDWPVMMVSWLAAYTYAGWFATRTNLPWRLPCELEWEKAARGVDARHFPWGDFLDPSWCCMRDSHAGPVKPPRISEFSEDISPYGVRGLTGGVQDWCLDAFTPEGSPEGRVEIPTISDPERPVRRCYRGGSWGSVTKDCRAAARPSTNSRVGTEERGFRLVRSL